MPSSHPLPQQEANLFKKILKCYEQKQYKKSLQYVKEILKKFPEHGETLSMKGLILNYCNKKAEAYECAQKGLRHDVKSNVCWHVYGLLQRSDRKYDEAIKCYRNALKCDPDNLQILRDLSLLQIQIRDLEGFRDTRYQLLQLRPTQRVSWIGYAMAYHLLKEHDLANDILEEFCKTQTKSVDLEQSELLLYQAMVYIEAGLYEQAAKHLEENAKYILDKLKYEEMRADSYFQAKQLDKARQVYESLIERNAENVAYYRRLEQCLELSSVEARVAFYRQYGDKYPRSDVPRRLPLEFLSGDEFRSAVDAYMRRALHKGVPPLYKQLKHLYADAAKLACIGELVAGYARHLTESGRFNASDASDQEKETPTTLLWVYYYLAQHCDHIGDTEAALDYINKAIDYTPTLVELYMIKGKIYKHAGNYYEAVRWLDEAQSLDTADRFVNYKCCKYMLRADMVKEAQEIAAKFTRENTPAFDYLREMQCMWFENECANAYRRLGKCGESLKKCHQVERHFQEIIEDQFDFHSYCMRKMTLCAYVNMLRLEDVIKSHPFFAKAAVTALGVYLRLHDRPLSELDEDAIVAAESLSASELKKLKNKQKKQQLKAQIEKDKQQQLELKKKELSKQKNKEDGGDADTINEDELVAEKLEKPENALDECARFLKPLEEYAPARLDTHMLAFEVYYRKDKHLLMLRSLKKMRRVDDVSQRTASKFHYYFGKFMIKYNESKEKLNPVTVQVIDKELTEFVGAAMCTEPVAKINETFIAESVRNGNYEAIVEAAKLSHLLNPGDSERKAVTLLTDVAGDKSYKIKLDVAKYALSLLVDEEYFGKVDEKRVDEFKVALRKLFPHAISFLSKEEQANEQLKCVNNLSMTLASAAEISEKLAETNLNTSANNGNAN